MTDENPAENPQRGEGPVEEVETNPPRRRPAWMRGVRWFAAEFLVVVSGVLVALALNAFYQGRLNAEREAGYLQQLASDLQESKSAFEEALVGNDAEGAKLQQLLQLFGAEEVPSEEAFGDLTTLSIHPAQPTLSTASAIVETGDLHLIRDDSLRTAIIQYVGAGQSYGEMQDGIAWDWLTPRIRAFYEIVRPNVSSDHPFATSPREALAQEALYDIVFDLQLGYLNHRRVQQRMLAGIRRMQAQVDRALSES